MQKNSLATQFIKYFGAALVGYVVDFGTLIFFKEVLNVHYLLSASAGFILGLVVVYIISNRYVFGESKLKSKTNEFILFAVIGIVGLGILNLVMWLLTSDLHVNYLASKILATVVVYSWNFFARRSMYHN